MDVGSPIREIEVIPEHIPVPAKEPSKTPTPVVPKEKEIVRNSQPGVLG